MISNLQHPKTNQNQATTNQNSVTFATQPTPHANGSLQGSAPASQHASVKPVVAPKENVASQTTSTAKPVSQAASSRVMHPTQAASQAAKSLATTQAVKTTTPQSATASQAKVSASATVKSQANQTDRQPIASQSANAANVQSQAKVNDQMSQASVASQTATQSKPTVASEHTTDALQQTQTQHQSVNMANDHQGTQANTPQAKTTDQTDADNTTVQENAVAPMKDLQAKTTNLAANSIVTYVPSHSLGVDVSGYQPGSVSRYAGKVKFVIVKVSEGDGDTNPEAAAQVRSAEANHMMVMAYHFAHFGGNSSLARQRAIHACANAQMDGIPRGTYIACDYETGASGNVQANTNAVIAFMDQVKREGYIPLLYSGQYYLNDNLYVNQITNKFGNCLWVARYPTMGASYGPNMDYFPDMNHVIIWQYTDDYEGLSADGDVNVLPLKFGSGNVTPSNPNPSYRQNYKTGDMVTINNNATKWTNGATIDHQITNGKPYLVGQVATGDGGAVELKAPANGTNMGWMNDWEVTPYTGIVKVNGVNGYWKNGDRQHSTFAHVGGHNYYFDNQGDMVYGYQTINGKKYYFNTTTGAEEPLPKINVTIDYTYNGKVIGQGHTTTVAGGTVNVSQDVPKGYHIAPGFKLSNSIPINNNQSSITVPVAPDAASQAPASQAPAHKPATGSQSKPASSQSPATGNIKVIIHYMDNGKEVGTATTETTPSKAVNVSQDIPKNYQLAPNYQPQSGIVVKDGVANINVPVVPANGTSANASQSPASQSQSKPVTSGSASQTGSASASQKPNASTSASQTGSASASQGKPVTSGSGSQKPASQSKPATSGSASQTGSASASQKPNASTSASQTGSTSASQGKPGISSSTSQKGSASASQKPNASTSASQAGSTSASQTANGSGSATQWQSQHQQVNIHRSPAIHTTQTISLAPLTDSQGSAATVTPSSASAEPVQNETIDVPVVPNATTTNLGHAAHAGVVNFQPTAQATHANAAPHVVVAPQSKVTPVGTTNQPAATTTTPGQTTASATTTTPSHTTTASHAAQSNVAPANHAALNPNTLPETGNQSNKFATIATESVAALAGILTLVEYRSRFHKHHDDEAE